MHRCDGKRILREFVIHDLASIHRREFHIINYNAVSKQRFVNLCQSLFQVD